MTKKPALLRSGAKVYVTHEQGFDFTPAQEYGEIEFLTRDDLVNIKGSLRNEALVDQLRFKLKKFDPQWDWILIAGSPYVSALVFLLLGHMGHKKLQVLRWSNQDRHYIPLYLDLPNV